MNVTFRCPSCDRPNRSALPGDPPDGNVPASVASDETGEPLRCAGCDWSSDDVLGAAVGRCVVCGCGDLWRQKDFPQGIGLGLVATGALLSTIAWAWYEPVWAIGILLFFAAIDLVLFALMPDVLVCYRCAAHYRGLATADDATYDHEVGERYRQEAIRLREHRQ